MGNADVVRRFEEEFKNRGNLAIVDELMAEDFQHHAPLPVPAGREGMKAIGTFVFGAIDQIAVTVDLIAAEGDLVADRISARGVRRDSGEPVAWTENHFYRVDGGRIAEWWGEGGPPLA